MGATSDTYKPKLRSDVGKHPDGDGELLRRSRSPLTSPLRRTAEAKNADNGVELDTRNKAPVFDLDEDEDGDRDTMVTRKVEENTEALARSRLTKLTQMTITLPTPPGTTWARR